MTLMGEGATGGRCSRQLVLLPASENQREGLATWLAELARTASRRSSRFWANSLKTNPNFQPNRAHARQIVANQAQEAQNKPNRAQEIQIEPDHIRVTGGAALCPGQGSQPKIIQGFRLLEQ